MRWRETRPHHVPSPRHDKSRMGKLHKPHEVSFMKLEDGHTSMSHHERVGGMKLQIMFRLLDTTSLVWDFINLTTVSSTRHTSMSHMKALEGDYIDIRSLSSTRQIPYGQTSQPHDKTRLEDGHTSMSHMKALEGDETSSRSVFSTRQVSLG